MLQAVHAAIVEHPGLRMIDVAHAINKPRSTVQRALPSMDLAGLLLSENEHGELYPFRVISLCDAQDLWRAVR